MLCMVLHTLDQLPVLRKLCQLLLVSKRIVPTVSASQLGQLLAIRTFSQLVVLRTWGQQFVPTDCLCCTNFTSVSTPLINNEESSCTSRNHAKRILLMNSLLLTLKWKNLETEDTLKCHIQFKPNDQNTNVVHEREASNRERRGSRKGFTLWIASSRERISNKALLLKMKVRQVHRESLKPSLQDNCQGLMIEQGNMSGQTHDYVNAKC